MARFVLYKDIDGKTKVKVSDEALRMDAEEKKRKEEERRRLVKKEGDEYWLNEWINRRRIKRQDTYIENFVKTNAGVDKYLIRRFFSKIDIKDEDECWNWLNYANKDGYGTFFLSGKKELSHRVSYVLHNKMLEDNLYVLHTCNNPLCCNPKHLYTGTQEDNMKYMTDMGRQAKAERLPQSKLSWEEVNKIRELWRTCKYYQKELATMFNITVQEVSYIVRNEIWKDAEYQKLLDNKFV